jgi:hypothetical protein
LTNRVAVAFQEAKGKDEASEGNAAASAPPATGKSTWTMEMIKPFKSAGGTKKVASVRSLPVNLTRSSSQNPEDRKAIGSRGKEYKRKVIQHDRILSLYLILC